MLGVEQPARKVWTEEEISRLPDNGYNVEVVDGELRMSPKNNPLHGRVCTRISMYMGLHAMQNRLGEVWDSNTGFWMANGNLRAPDVSFVSATRLIGRPLTSFFKGAPDLAVEVLSPSNSRREIEERLRDFFASGTKLAWVIDPDQESAEICRSLSDRTMIGPNSVLDGEDVLNGFKVTLSDLFVSWI
jgi:Uma2 family endonuclease